MRSKLQLASLTLLCLATAPAASAQSPQTVPGPPIVITRKLPPSADFWVRVVYVGDLDLKSAAGQQEMDKRVGKAVDEICAIPTPLPSYKGPMEKPCRDEAWAGARSQMANAVQSAGGS
jgi:UrcA family protein